MKKGKLLKIKLIVLIIFTIMSFSCQQKKQSGTAVLGIGEKSKEKISVFLDYGPAPEVGRATERDSVATKKFGFIIKSDIGCEVTDELLDSITQINSKSNNEMILKKGENWQQQFEKSGKLHLNIPNLKSQNK